MYRQFEIVLSIVSLVFTFLFAVLIVNRIRLFILKRKRRISVWSKETGLINRMAKLIMAIAIPFFAAGLLYYLFIITLPTSVIRDYIKILFSVLFIAWLIIEFILCFQFQKRSSKVSDSDGCCFSLWQ